MKLPFVIYVNFESIVEKTGTCDSNPEASYGTEIYKRTTCGFSSFVKYIYDSFKNE